MTAVEERPKAADLLSSLTEAGDKLRHLREMPADKRGDTFESDFRETIRQINSWDAELKIAKENERAVLEELQFNAAVAADQRSQSRGPSAATGNVTGSEARTLGEMVTESEGFRNWHDNGRALRDFRFDFDDVETRALITSSTSDTPAAGLLRPVGQPIAPTPRERRFFIRDLLASGTTGVASFPYIRELNPATNETAASATPEASAKPEATMSFVQVTATVHKIAAWVPATEEILEDAPTLRSYIDNRLVYMVKVREEADLIAGVESGANPTVPGITTVSGTQSQSAVQTSATDDIFKTLGTAIGKVENVDGFADGIAMNPIDYWAAMTTRWGTDGNFDAGNPFNGPPGTIWGLPVVRTRSLSTSQAIVADWRDGGQVFDRRGVTVRTSDSHDDYFVKNKIAILAEERLAVAWYRPDFFVIVDLTT